jgi:MFS family permease
VRSGFATPTQIATVEGATLFGLFAGTLAQDEFTDRLGLKTVYQFNLLLYGLATIAAAFSPSYVWLAALRFAVCIGLAHADEYAPKTSVAASSPACRSVAHGSGRSPLCLPSPAATRSVGAASGSSSVPAHWSCSASRSSSRRAGSPPTAKANGRSNC